MRRIEKNLGVATADGENVNLRYDGNDLILAFTDWQERPQGLIFRDVLAFRWQELDEEGVQNDRTYEVVDSPWLQSQAVLQAVPASEFAHYTLCFNGSGVVDVLARRL